MTEKQLSVSAQGLVNYVKLPLYAKHALLGITITKDNAKLVIQIVRHV